MAIYRYKMGCHFLHNMRMMRIGRCIRMANPNVMYVMYVCNDLFCQMSMKRNVKKNNNDVKVVLTTDHYQCRCRLEVERSRLVSETGIHLGLTLVM